MIQLCQLFFAVGLILMARGKKLSGGDLPPIPHVQHRPLPPAIWGHWTNYGPCSRTCGRGVKMRTRDCLQWTGERYTETHLTACAGNNIDYRLCELGKCSHDEDFRAYQCRILSKTRHVAGRIHQWIPYDGGKPCELNCKAVGRSYYYSFGTVQDGTLCLNTNNHVCVHGQCKLIGCDDHVGGGTRMDMCGVCNGKNDTCSFIKSTYRTELPTGRGKHRGYNEVVTIPRGSTHFSVKESSRNHLALMNSKNNFVLNGHYTIASPGIYSIGGTVVTYDRVNTGYEALQGDGPTSEDLHVMLMYREQNRGVNYEFWVPGIPSLELLNMTFLRFDNAIPVDAVTDVETTTTRYTVPPSPSRKTTLSDNQIWDIVMSEMDNGGKVTKQYDLGNGGRVTKQYHGDRIQRTHGKSKTLDKRKNATKEKVRQDRLARKKLKKKSKKKKRKFLSKSQCPTCKKIQNRKKQFCASDFVSKARVNGFEVFGNATRYDISIMYTYRNIVPLLHREYIWVYNICKCPRLRTGREYILMGMMEHHGQREIRLSVSPNSYVRKFSFKQDIRMQKLKRKRSKCKKKKRAF
ncbi:ADAMTS-like protein 5 [Haliotis rufescens]|uniref:ADAMTS-like protein 5 n=1 Tax=Haliotis rufescens TaxID=6454 RepID=UPI001EB01258|nr:ADAMTS-like protein 5 [Haliotis rufescens]